MNSPLFNILGLMDTLNDWNDKLNKFASEHMDNVAVGAGILLLLVVVAVWGIRTFNKK